MAALCCFPVLAWAQNPPPHQLPLGTELQFVADDAVDVRSVQPGGHYRAHLVHDLVLDGQTIAPAGTTARLTVLDKPRQADGTVALSLAIGDFHLHNGAEVPVRVVPAEAIRPAVTPGTTVAVQTLGIIEADGDMIVVRVPLPFSLSADQPSAAYTPFPARTPPVFHPSPRPGQRGYRPPPTPSPSPSPAPDATGSP